LEERLAVLRRKRIIHFGSCGTLAAHANRLNRLMERTGAYAVCGYNGSGDWMQTAAFEPLLLSGFQFNALTRAGMQVVERRTRRRPTVWRASSLSGWALTEQVVTAASFTGYAPQTPELF
jgi:hypothetical protein